MGALCWARWEVARSLLADLTRTEISTGEIERILTRVAPAREAADATRLPSDVAVFAADLFAMLDSVGATAVALDSVSVDQFNFEKLEGVEAYVAAAADEPNCVRP